MHDFNRISRGFALPCIHNAILRRFIVRRVCHPYLPPIHPISPVFTGPASPLAFILKRRCVSATRHTHADSMPALKKHPTYNVNRRTSRAVLLFISHPLTYLLLAVNKHPEAHFFLSLPRLTPSIPNETSPAPAHRQNHISLWSPKSNIQPHISGAHLALLFKGSEVRESNIPNTPQAALSSHITSPPYIRPIILPLATACLNLILYSSGTSRLSFHYI